MTKKDYELLAKPFHFFVTQEYATRKHLDEEVSRGRNVNRTINEAKIEQLAQMQGFLSTSLKYENPKFDENKFATACGFVNN